MVYLPANPKSPSAALEWIDRNGNVSEVGSLPEGRRVVAQLSPDGSTAAVLVGPRVFLIDLIRNVTTPIDLGRRQTESVGWHPDGKRLVLGGGTLSLFDPDSGKETRLTEIPGTKRFASFSPDGRTVAFMTFAPNDDIQVLSLEPYAKPRPFVATEAIENNPVISPDGHWMAYTATAAADATGRNDVYVVRFPEGTGKVQITNRGGGAPFWSHDGRELFFPAPPGTLQAVPITSGDRLQVGPVRTLFPLGDRRIAGVSPDGSRFLAVRRPGADAPTEMVVVQQWLQELNRIAPTR
jgi:Tol biopolymer transport system component